MSISKKKSKKKGKPKSYRRINNELSYEDTRLQAARMLDEAGFRAIKNGDVNEMLAVALAWHEFSGAAFDAEEQGLEEDDEYHGVQEQFKVIGLGSHEERSRKEQEYHAGREEAKR